MSWMNQTPSCFVRDMRKGCCLSSTLSCIMTIGLKRVSQEFLPWHPFLSSAGHACQSPVSMNTVQVSFLTRLRVTSSTQARSTSTAPAI